MVASLPNFSQYLKHMPITYLPIVQKFSFMSIANYKLLQNQEVNLESLSKIMEIGIPCNLITSLTYNRARWSAESEILAKKERIWLVDPQLPRYYLGSCGFLVNLSENPSKYAPTSILVLVRIAIIPQVFSVPLYLLIRQTF